MSADTIARRLPYTGGFPVYLSRYVILGTAGRRAALRFFNASEIAITGIRFRLIERDGAGNVLAEHTLERSGLYSESGNEFAVNDAPVEYGCMAVEAKVEAVISDDYEYVVEEDGVRLQYGTSKREKEIAFSKKPTYSRSRRRGRYLAIAIFSVLGFAVAAAGLAWRFGFYERRIFENFGREEAYAAYAESDGSMTDDVEA